MLKMYWPMAEYKQKADDCQSVFNKLWTYSPCDTMAEARDVIRRWASDCNYHLTKAWIDCVYHNGDNETKRRVSVL